MRLLLSPQPSAVSDARVLGQPIRARCMGSHCATPEEPLFLVLARRQGQLGGLALCRRCRDRRNQIIRDHLAPLTDGTHGLRLLESRA
ncbi:hypothetical protein [Candidatus Nitrospira bockiana]